MEGGISNDVQIRISRLFETIHSEMKGVLRDRKVNL